MPTTEDPKSGQRTEDKVYQMPEPIAVCVASGRHHFAYMLASKIESGELNIGAFGIDVIADMIRLLGDVIEDKADLKLKLENVRGELEETRELLTPFNEALSKLKGSIKNAYMLAEQR